jgi:ssDNA-binding Zn-finger/Zn-ribbon topoisomerase 1
MGINDRMVFMTPGLEDMYVAKASVEGQTCPECSGTDIKRYPVAHFTGPRIVVKCQSCYHSLSVERPALEDNWPPFRAATYDWDAADSEHASTVE